MVILDWCCPPPLGHFISTNKDCEISWCTQYARDKELRAIPSSIYLKSKGCVDCICLRKFNKILLLVVLLLLLLLLHICMYVCYIRLLVLLVLFQFLETIITIPFTFWWILNPIHGK